MKKLFLPLCLLCTGFLLHAADLKTIPVEHFVSALRSPASGDTWGRLSGTVFHRRRGMEPVEAPLSFRTLFSSKTTVGQLIFRENEICQLTQSRIAPYSSSVETNGKSTLQDVGLLPSDLVMNFIYWDFKGELEPQNIRMQDCRVLLFESPETKQQVKVYASATYIFPVRVEWIDPGTKKKFRTLEVNGLKKVNDLWVVEELAVSGPGWKSIIRFKNLEAGYTKQGIPTDLFAE